PPPAVGLRPERGIPARPRATPPGPPPPPGARSRAPTGPHFKNRPRRRIWLGRRPRTSSGGAIVSADGWASTTRQGSGCGGDAVTLADVTPRAVLAAKILAAVGAASAHRARADDVGLAHGILHQLVVDRDGRPRASRDRTTPP